MAASADVAITAGGKPPGHIIDKQATNVDARMRVPTSATAWPEKYGGGAGMKGCA
jgi:hypothetical protein